MLLKANPKAVPSRNQKKRAGTPSGAIEKVYVFRQLKDMSSPKSRAGKSRSSREEVQSNSGIAQVTKLLLDCACKEIIRVKAFYPTFIYHLFVLICPPRRR